MFQMNLQKYTLLISAIFVLLFIQHRSHAFAAEANLSWDANTESDLAGYKVYVGTSPQTYDSPIDVGNKTSHILTNLDEGFTYYFVLTAYDTSANESGFSAEVSKDIPVTDTTPPVLSAVSENNVTETSVNITWTTNEPANSLVEYGITTAYGSTSALGTSSVNNHNRPLSNLSPGTTYQYRVLSADAAGNQATSGNFSFVTTSAPDTTPPEISNISESGITENSATITWDTNEPANSLVEYGTTSAYGSTTTRSTTFLSSHSRTLSNLNPGTTYHYRVVSIDAEENGSNSGNFIFMTPAAPDTTAPVLSNIQGSNINATETVITWQTDEPASSRVEYGLTSTYGSTSTLDNTGRTSHSRTLTNLSPDTQYNYRVISTDLADNTAVSANATFTTSSSPDTDPPLISNIVIETLNDRTAIISWQTNEAASSQIEYGLNQSYGNTTPRSNTPVTGHRITLLNLSAATTYHYRVMSEDAAGNASASANQSFMTANAPDTTAPNLLNINTNNITPTTVSITWTTDEFATGQVEYGETEAYGESTPLNLNLSITHQFTLAQLMPETQYYYRVKSGDAIGNQRSSQTQSFSTSAAPTDTTPPENIRSFSNSPGDQEVTLEWQTPSDPDFVGVRIRFRNDRIPNNIEDGSLLGDFTAAPDTKVTFVHKNLKNGETYYYIAAAYDAAGNLQEAITLTAKPNKGESASGGGGGCGIVLPRGGNPPGPGDAAGMMAIIGIMLLLLLKKSLKTIHTQTVVK